MITFIKSIFNLNRSITGPETLKTLKFIKKNINKLKIKKIKTSSKVFDWKVPKEWHIKEAYIKDEDGKIIIDIKNNNLHVLNFSNKISKWFSLNEAKKNIFYLKKIPNAIPYVTSYYKKRWGFCMTYNQFKKLDKNKKYFFYINSFFKEGFMNYGEVYIPGESKKEILLSTYVCHPSMANNELSGPAVLTYLLKWIIKKRRHLSYRAIFIPETIGSIAYLSKNLDKLKKRCLGGFVFSCLGDKGNFSVIKSKYNRSFIDFSTQHVLKKNLIPHRIYSYLERGSDERQFCSQGINFNFNTLTRTKFGKFKEYHTSLDNLNFINNRYLKKSLQVSKLLISYIDESYFPKSKIKCEPFLTKRKLYPTINFLDIKPDTKILDVLNFCDGTNNVDQICEFTKLKKIKVLNYLKQLKKLKIIE